MVNQINRLVSSAAFRNLITSVNIASGVVIGIETYPGIYEKYRDLLHVLGRTIL